MYYDSYNGLEIAAKKAYHEDPWSSSSEDEVKPGPPGSNIEMSSLGSQLNDSMIYEGGNRNSTRKDKNSRKKNNNGGQEQSLLMKILSCGGKSKSDANSDNT